MCCSDFWNEMARSYPDIAKMALGVPMPFLTTYECETAFSTLFAIKAKDSGREMANFKEGGEDSSTKIVVFRAY
ncbi:Hypothetical predicted protein [Octopus vulgaris]|uniref:Uncharacterized protein n=1 Tax=Octopus vulgaris TaxID=6645 RepID=A0AA36B175_OCTVU|nr:Hypothetical predicted protein [Octopus vulgaris]